MKFLPIQEFAGITSALNFRTAECRVKGACELYTTKAAGSDKKLYKTIDVTLEEQHAALLKLGESLSLPHKKDIIDSMNLSRSSPFGSLNEASNRRTFAYLIATLNASHPDYDFSHVLRPTDFRRMRNLQYVMANVDNTLNNVRPFSTSVLSADGNSSYRSYSSSPATSFTIGGDIVSSPSWSPHMWTMIDKEMTLRDCMIFSYEPAEEPFDGDESAIWRIHYLFFNKNKKRVAYLYVRGLPILVNSPALAPHRRGSNGLSKRYATPLSSSWGPNKRAKFWLGDQLANRIVIDEDDEEYFDEDDMIPYNSDEDIDIDPLNDPSSEEEESDDYDDDEEEEEETDESEDDKVAYSVRGVSEDIAMRMEV